MRRHAVKLLTSFPCVSACLQNLLEKHLLNCLKQLFTAKILSGIWLVLAQVIGAQAYAVDARSYQHGIKIIQDINKNHWLIWSSSPGNPPQGETRVKMQDGTKCSYFTHNIYYSPLNVNKPVIEPRLLLGLPEAQEPVDAAIAANGVIAITYEDGSESNVNNCDGVIEQRFQVYTRFPKSPLAIKTVKVPGAHSGHVAAVGNNFVVVYAEGWMDGGGVDQAGSANDIYLDVFNFRGKVKKHKPIAVDKGYQRDWWPLVAGSSRVAMLVWQRYVDKNNYANLMITVYDPKTNRLIKPVTKIKENLQYYHYDIQYLSSIDRFLVIGNYLGKVNVSGSRAAITPRLFAYLFDESGNIVDRFENTRLCNICGSYLDFNLVREAKPAINNKSDGQEQKVTVYYPIKPDGVISLQVTDRNITFNNVAKVKHFWFPMGADGLVVGDGKILFANLTLSGVKLIEASMETQ